MVFFFRNCFTVVVANLMSSAGQPRELRPRQVEWNKPLPIIRDIADLQDEDIDEADLEEAGLLSDSALLEKQEEKGGKIPDTLSKEIFIPAAQPLSVDLKEAGIEFTYVPIDRSATKRYIRWRGFLDPQGNPIAEEDPLSPLVTYHLYSGDVALLKEINKFKTLIPKEDYRKAFDTWEKATSTGPIIEQSRAIDLATKRGLDCQVHILNEVYKAWVLRRQQVKRPLMRLFWPVGVAGEEPPTSTTLRFRAAAKMRLRRPRRNNEDLLQRAGVAKRDAKNVIKLVRRMIMREKLKSNKVQLSNAIARQTRIDFGLSKRDPNLEQAIASANAALAEEVLPVDETTLIESHRHIRTKLLMVAESPRAGGGMLGGIAAISGAAEGEDGGGKHGVMGQAYLNSQRVKTRVRIGRSNRIYIDRVREADRDNNKFLPMFEQWDEFGVPENIGAMCPEADVKEFADKYLDELFDLTKAIRTSIFQLSSDTLPSLSQTCDSEDTRHRDVEWFSESWKAYKTLNERIKTEQPFASSTQDDKKSW
jgi:hypothetical protein